jgi:NADH dehydrogenase
VVLLESADRLLGAFSPELAADALRSLQSKGVEVRLRAAVKKVEPGRLELADGEAIEAATVIWTAGVKASPLGYGLGRSERHQQLVVGPSLQLPGHPEVFVVGDLAAVEGSALPMLAPVAMQQGAHAARAIRSLASGVALRPFRYVDRGIMATIGRSSAVVELRRFHFRGLLGWLIWLFLHLLLLVGFRNRVVALVNWAWDYLLWDRPIRLIVRPARPPALEP